MSNSSFNDVGDMELVLRFKAGDEPAFCELMGRHRPRIHALTLRLLRNQHDAEEITQDVFIRAHRALHSFRGDCEVSTWFYWIGRRLCYNRFAHRERRQWHTTHSLDLPVGDSGTPLCEIMASDAPTPACTAEEAELLERIDLGMTRLPEKYRRILTLRNVLHHPYDEIAEMLGLNIGTVKSRIARAREALRAELIKHLPTEAEKEAFAS